MSTPVWKTVRLPFGIGQRVRHRVDFAVGIVVAIRIYKTGRTVETSSGLDGDCVSWDFALEETDGSEGDQAWMRTCDLPYEWGHRVKHRADGKPGVVTGYRLHQDGLEARVAWSSSSWDWHELCELED